MRIPPGGRHGRRGERGIVLLLTLAVLFISISLVAQLAIGSAVAHASMRNRADTVRMEWACRSAAEEALNLLRDDAATGAEGMSAMGGALGAGGFPPGAEGAAGGAAGAAGAEAGGAAGGEGGGEGAGGEEEEAAVDSFEDTWAKPMRIMIGDLEITTFVQDENAKYNLHLLAVAEPDRRELEKERVMRILDALREEFDDDLDESESRIIVDELIQWMDPRGRQTELPLHPRHSLGERQDAEFALLGTLEELLLLEHVDESLYYDQVRGEEIAPGLESVFTIWTTIAFAAPSAGDTSDADAAAAAAGAAGAAGTGGAAAGAGAAAGTGGLPMAAAGEDEVRGEGGLAGALDGNPPIGTKINLNTAARAVIEGLMPEYRLPRRQTTEILRWRNEVDEEELDARDGEEVDTEDRELRDALFGEEEEDPKQVFKSLEDLRLVPGFEEGALPADVEQELTDLLGVQSDVFTVYLYARVKQDLAWEPEQRYQEMPGTVLRLRSVVWRRTGQDGPVLLFLQPWQVVPATRWRIPDFQDELPTFRAPRYGN
jgi:hypothetical protein